MSKHLTKRGAMKAADNANRHKSTGRSSGHARVDYGFRKCPGFLRTWEVYPRSSRTTELWRSFSRDGVDDPSGDSSPARPPLV